MFESAFTTPPPSSQAQKLELSYFQRNQHTALEESGIADTARLSVSEEALEDMDALTQMSIFMGGGIDPEKGAYFNPVIRFITHGNRDDGDQMITGFEAVGVGRFYIESEELETLNYFSDEEFYQVLDMIKGMKQAKMLRIIPGLSLNLVEINSSDNSISEMILESTEDYLDKLAA